MKEESSKVSPKVLIVTIVILFGVVGYFAFFNKDDIPVISTPESKIYVAMVELEEKEITLNIGDEKELTAKITPDNATNKKVTWISNNDTVVKVDTNGKITGLSVGRAIITVKTDDSNRTDTCTVRVVDQNNVSSNNVDAIGVSLSKSSLSMLKGDSYHLVATIKPVNATNKSVIWSSSNENIVTVDNNGKIMAKETGKATITVKTKDGGKTATCQITVFAEAIPVTGVVLNRSEVTLLKGDSVTLSAKLTPDNATNNNVTWTSSRPEVAKVDENGVVTGLKAGKTTITVKTKDGNKTDKCEITVENITVDVEEIKLNTEELTMTLNETKQLTATITPANATNKKIRWTTSDKMIAKVDDTGKITPVNIGKVLITAEASNGKKTAKCVVTITR